ncbi:S-adenosylmethionine decarboxylase [Pseudonocardia sp. CA-107938]|uniref:S-adenosylmethionine decarboxylase n=1 Tax=Pseudonocardia sp. CA-107938 TaxID=3240021 RepID=UPI003D931678
MHHYGDELSLRIVDVSRVHALDDDATIAALMVQLVERVGMRILAGPLVGTEQGGPLQSGKSAVLILAESHAALHTYPELGQAFFNLFSCKPFDESTVLATLTEFLGDFTVEERALVQRGDGWPQQLHAAAEHWRRDRGAARDA